ncbi:DUF4493 domain-containing protein [Flammeovirga sp. MY04]|uniref:DUF4493 domain-containing protein n=1 Tax=Flammeovirga sp. MY04 TaxID=1191459 RepID=UPI0008062D76|nr:DUF4493 domain-containing protein [Flammeovirga sp. MY04]ANQ52647.1 DUF4493 domain-containing protein [Flammeovirga sp. MY04]
MKRYNLKSLWLLFIVFLMWSCHKKDDEQLAEGTLSLEISRQAVIEEMSSARTNVEHFNISIYNQRDELIHYFERYDEMPSDLPLREGTYLIKVASGEDVPAAFDHAIYRGETEFTIKGNQKNTVSVVCTQTNVKVTVGYTDFIKKGFKDFSVEVHTEEGNLLFEKEEEKAGYFKITPDSTLHFTINVTNLQGNEFSRSMLIEDIKPREHYHVVFDLEGIGGSANINIKVDESTNDKKWDFEMPINPNHIPVITSEQFDFDNPPNIRYSDGMELILKVDASVDLSSVMWTSESTYFTDQGLPKQFDILHPTQEQLQILNALGVVVSTVGNEVNISLSELTKKLPTNSTQPLIHEIEWKASNQEGINYIVKTPLRVIPLGKNVRTLSVDAWSKFAYLYGEYNDLETSEIVFQYRKVGAIDWEIINAIDVENDHLYSAQILGLDHNTDYEFRAYSSEEVVGEVKQFTTEEIVPVPYIDFQTWFQVGSGNSYYQLPGNSLSDSPWRSGDKGAADLTFSQYMKTVLPKPSMENPEFVRLETNEAMGFKAAGSLFLGDIQGSGLSTVKINFGIPFTSRPTKFSFDYQYNPLMYDGKMDELEAYLILQVREGDKRYRLATAWLRSDEQKTEWTTADLEVVYGYDSSLENYMLPKSNFVENPEEGFYPDVNAKPTHLLIVFSSSAHGADKKSAAKGTIFDIKNLNIGYEK